MNRTSLAIPFVGFYFGRPRQVGKTTLGKEFLEDPTGCRVGGVKDSANPAEFKILLFGFLGW